MSVPRAGKKQKTYTENELKDFMKKAYKEGHSTGYGKGYSQGVDDGIALYLNLTYTASLDEFELRKMKLENAVELLNKIRKRMDYYATALHRGDIKLEDMQESNLKKGCDISEFGEIRELKLKEADGNE